MTQTRHRTSAAPASESTPAAPVEAAEPELAPIVATPEPPSMLAEAAAVVGAGGLDDGSGWASADPDPPAAIDTRATPPRPPPLEPPSVPPQGNPELDDGIARGIHTLTDGAALAIDAVWEPLGDTWAVFGGALGTSGRAPAPPPPVPPLVAPVPVVAPPPEPLALAPGALAAAATTPAAPTPELDRDDPIAPVVAAALAALGDGTSAELAVEVAPVPTPFAPLALPADAGLGANVAAEGAAEGASTAVAAAQAVAAPISAAIETAEAHGAVTEDGLAQDGAAARDDATATTADGEQAAAATTHRAEAGLAHAAAEATGADAQEAEDEQQQLPSPDTDADAPEAEPPPVELARPVPPEPVATTEPVPAEAATPPTGATVADEPVAAVEASGTFDGALVPAEVPIDAAAAEVVDATEPELVPAAERVPAEVPAEVPTDVDAAAVEAVDATEPEHVPAEVPAEVPTEVDATAVEVVDATEPELVPADAERVPAEVPAEVPTDVDATPVEAEPALVPADAERVPAELPAVDVAPMAEPAVVEPAVVEPAVVEPAVVEPAVIEPAVVEPEASEPELVPADVSTAPVQDAQPLAPTEAVAPPAPSSTPEPTPIPAPPVLALDAGAAPASVEPAAPFDHPIAAALPAVGAAADAVLGEATARAHGATTAAAAQVDQAAAAAAPGIDAAAAADAAAADLAAQQRAAEIAARRDAESAGVIAGSDDALGALADSDAAWREDLAAHTAAAHAAVDADADAQKRELHTTQTVHVDHLESTARTHRVSAETAGAAAIGSATARGHRLRADVATSRAALEAELEASITDRSAELEASRATAVDEVHADFTQWRLDLRIDAALHRADVDAALTDELAAIDAAVDARVESVHTAADTERTLLDQTRRDEEAGLRHTFDLQVATVRATAETRADEVLDYGVACSTRIVEQGNEDATAAIAAANARADQYPVRPGPAAAEQNARNRELARAARAAGQRQASTIRGNARARGAEVSRQAMADAADLRAQGEAEVDGLTARRIDLSAGLAARHAAAVAAVDDRADAGVTALEQERQTASDAARAEADAGRTAIDDALDAGIAALDQAEQDAVTAIDDATTAAREQIEADAAEGRALLASSEDASLAELDAQITALCDDLAAQVDGARAAIESARVTAEAAADAAIAAAEAEIDAATTAARERVDAADAGLAAVLDEVVSFTTAGIEEARDAGLASLAEWGDYARSELIAETVLRMEAIDALASERRAALRDARERALDEIGVLADAFPASLDQAVTEAGQVFDAVQVIREGTEDVALADGDSERDAATVAAAASLAEQLEALPPGLRAQVMAEVDDDVRVLVDELGSLTGDQTRDALASFTRAGEALGPEHVALLTDVVADGLQDQLDGHHDNPDEIASGIRAAIVDGDGALFASALAESLHDKGQVVLAGKVAGFAEDGVSAVMEDYRDALAEFEEYEAFLANWTLQNGPIVGADAVAAAEQAFRDEHHELYEAFLAEQQRYLTVLDGAAYAVDAWADNDGMVVGAEPTPLEPSGTYREVDDDDSAMFDAMYHVTTLQSGLERDAASGQWVASSVGQDALTDAMLREGAGERTFLSTAAAQGERFDARAHDEAGLDDDETLSVGWSDRMGQTLDLTLVSAAQNALLRDLDGDGLGDLDVDTLTDSLEAWGRIHATLGSDELDYDVFAREAAREILEVRDRVVAGELAYADLITTTRAAFAAGTSDPISAARAGYPDELSPTLSASLAAIGDTIGIVQGVAGWGDASVAGRVQTGVQPLVLAQRLLDAKGARTLAETGLPSRATTVANGIGLVSGVVDFAAGLDSLLRDDATMAEAFSTAMGGSAALGALAELSGMAKTARLFGKASTVLAVGLSVFEAGAAAIDQDWDRAALAALPAIGAGVGALFGGIGAPVGLAIGTLAQFALGSLLSRDPNEDYEAATQIAWSAAITSLVPGASSLDVDRLSHELRNVDDDWVGAGPVLALVAREAGMTPEVLFAGLLDLAHREDGVHLLNQVVAHNLLDADLTNWDAVVEASEAVLSDPTVEIPALEYDRAQIRDLASWLSEGIETDGDSFFRYTPYTYVDAQDVSGQVAEAYNEWIHWRTEHPDEPVPEALEYAVNTAPPSMFTSSGSFEHAEFPVSSDERISFDAGLPEVAAPDPDAAAGLVPPAPAPEPAFEAVPTEVLSAVESQVEAMGYRRGTPEFDAMVWGIVSAGLFG